MSKNKKKYPKVGLALSGGSALGICHVGVVKALMENKIPIDCVSGTSAGAIVAACVAFGVPIKKMMEISKELNWSKISQFGYSKLGISSNRPMGEIMRELLGDVKIEDAYIPLAIVATNVDNGEEVIFRKGSVAEAVMASTCIPAIFVPVKIKGKKMVDGGLVENLPLSPLKKMGAKVMIAVDLEHNKKLKKSHNVFEVVINSYDILMKAQEEEVCDGEIVIEPDLKKFTPSDFEKYEELIKEGYEAASLAIGKIKNMISENITQPEGFFKKLSNFFRFKK